MNTRKELQHQVMMAARDQGIASVLFRNALARQLGLNTTESDCLSYLGANQVAAPTEIARYAGLTTGATTTMLDRLEKAHFITRKPNPNDRRGVLIEASEEWQQKAGPLVADIVKAHADLIGHYSDEQLETIADFLTHFTENVQNQTKAIEKA